MAYGLGMAKKTTRTPIACTKHHHPQVVAGLVARPRLPDRLQQHTWRAMTPASAQAGSTKSTQMARWQ